MSTAQDCTLVTRIPLGIVNSAPNGRVFCTFVGDPRNNIGFPLGFPLKQTKKGVPTPKERRPNVESLDLSRGLDSAAVNCSAACVSGFDRSNAKQKFWILSLLRCFCRFGDVNVSFLLGFLFGFGLRVFRAVGLKGSHTFFGGYPFLSGLVVQLKLKGTPPLGSSLFRHPHVL